MMRVELETEILKGVSRSFYLSLRLLPRPMRRAAGIAYLMARTSDTIADSLSGSSDARIAALKDYLAQVKGEISEKPFPAEVASPLVDPKEEILLLNHNEILRALRDLDENQRSLILEVLEIIVSGQILDLETFGDEKGNLRAFQHTEELDGYTWRVAGCVGVFWTRLGVLTMGEAFSTHAQAELEQWGREYGQGLQLVNILRDFYVDRKMGRCYLPVADPSDSEDCLREYHAWRRVALEKIRSGRAYAGKLRSWRLRMASGLPALIAEETLARLDIRHISSLELKVKVPRKRLYYMIFRQILNFGNFRVS
jgi:farnesyl-diphosphate farnesyltransferase